MKEVKRWDTGMISDSEVRCWEIGMISDSDGKYVQYEDYDRLRKATQGLLDHAVILSREYLAKFDQYWETDMIQGWEKRRWLKAADAADEAKAVLKGVEDKPGLCEECGKYPADTPSTLCAGCDAYAEHQGG